MRSQSRLRIRKFDGAALLAFGTVLALRLRAEILRADRARLAPVPELIGHCAGAARPARRTWIQIGIGGQRAHSKARPAVFQDACACCACLCETIV